MHLNIRDSKIAQLVKKRNTLSLVLVCSLSVNLLQGITVLNLVDKTRTVIVPPDSREFWVSSKMVSVSYLQQMTDYFLTLILNTTPSTAAYKRETLLKFVHPSHYGLVKEQLITDETEIQKRHISRFFVPVSYEVNEADHSVKTLGDLTTLVGQEKVSVERLEYQLQYHIEEGQLLIEAISEGKAHD
jgi:type IV conjugative transfer system protein TraE